MLSAQKSIDRRSLLLKEASRESPFGTDAQLRWMRAQTKGRIAQNVKSSKSICLEQKNFLNPYYLPQLTKEKLNNLLLAHLRAVLLRASTRKAKAIPESQNKTE